MEPLATTSAEAGRFATASYPSGHALLSAAVYLTLGTLVARFTSQLRLLVYFIVVAFLLTLLVGASRVYLAVHYPSDVLAGWCAGVAWAPFVGLVIRFLQRRGSIDDEGSPPDATRA